MNTFVLNQQDTYWSEQDVATSIEPNVSVAELLRRCTFMQCFECSSVHIMDCYNEKYECEECFRTVDWKHAIKNKEELWLNTKQLAHLLNTHSTPNKIIKMLMRVYLNEDDLTDTNVKSLRNRVMLLANINPHSVTMQELRDMGI